MTRVLRKYEATIPVVVKELFGSKLDDQPDGCGGSEPMYDSCDNPYCDTDIPARSKYFSLELKGRNGSSIEITLCKECFSMLMGEKNLPPNPYGI